MATRQVLLKRLESLPFFFRSGNLPPAGFSGALCTEVAGQLAPDRLGAERGNEGVTLVNTGCTTRNLMRR